MLTSLGCLSTQEKELFIDYLNRRTELSCITDSYYLSAGLYTISKKKPDIICRKNNQAATGGLSGKLLNSLSCVRYKGKPSEKEGLATIKKRENKNKHLHTEKRYPS